ncbi:hypothetical protein [Corynebacterium variabile]|uniref:hypothetical protein n=1 Tax=Corynebacterium variabile TaxID=1727 RepID=UPI0028A621EA|nr:hypothetical protein [Corynebacterium variabile]
MADRTAWRITSSNGWWSVFGKERGKGRRPGPPVHDDRCAVVDEHGRTRHVFVAERVNELWLVDITEHKTAEGKLYACAVKDTFSGRIVGYSISSTGVKSHGWPSRRSRMPSRCAVMWPDASSIRTGALNLEAGSSCACWAVTGSSGWRVRSRCEADVMRHHNM